MTVRGLKKQLLGAIIALALMLACLSSATYAWFVMNTSVSANGMQISVATEGVNFEITNRWDSVNSRPIFTSGQTQINVQYTTQRGLIPIHPENLRAYTGSFVDVADWYHAFSNDYDDANVTKTGTQWTNVQTDLTTDRSLGYGYFWDGVIGSSTPVSEAFAMAVPFYVRLNPDGTDANVKLRNIKATNLSITDSSGKNKLVDCVYLLVSGPSGTYRITMPDTTDGESVLVNIPAESGVLIDLLEHDDEYKMITVIAYFDGRDKDCKSSNYDASGISISLSFVGTQA